MRLLRGWWLHERWWVRLLALMAVSVGSIMGLRAALFLNGGIVFQKEDFLSFARSREEIVTCASDLDLRNAPCEWNVQGEMVRWEDLLNPHQWIPETTAVAFFHRPDGSGADDGVDVSVTIKRIGPFRWVSGAYCSRVKKRRRTATSLSMEFCVILPERERRFSQAAREWFIEGKRTSGMAK